MKTRTPARLISPMLVAPAFLAALAGVANAEIPAVMDRVPADAPIVVTIRSIDDLVARYEPLFQQLRAMGGEGEDPFKVVKAVRAIKGVDPKRSVAMVLTKLNDKPKGEGAGEEPGMVERNDEGVVLLPVTSYAEFVDATGGKPGENVTRLSLGDEEMYAKDAGGGYAAISNKTKAVEAFTPATGQLPAHTKAFGVVGNRVADKCDILVISSFASLKGKIEEGVAEMDKQLEGGMPPGMDQMKAGMDFMKDMAKAVARDGSVGVLGLSKSEAGIIFDGAAQFREGTETASKFKIKGNSASNLARLPSKPFLFAGGMDLSSPTMKKMLGELAKAGQKAAGGEKPAEDPMNWIAGIARNIESTDGAGFMVGATDNMAAGLLVNSASFTATKNPAALLASMRDSHLGAHGKTINGMTFANEWKAGEKEIAGAGKADVYTSKITLDQDDPNAFMASMGLGMMFGDQGGMSGFAMATKSGLVMTMSQNAPLMSSAVEAANAGNGLGTIDTVKTAAAMLPEHRIGEMYLGTKEIVNAIAQAAGAFGGLDLHFTMPEKVSAIGTGAAMDGEGLHLRVAIPQDAFDTILSVLKQAKAQNDEMMGGDPAGEGAKQPKF